MPRIDLTPYDITTPKPHPEKGTAWTVPGTDVGLVPEYVQCKQHEVSLWAPTSGATTESVKRTRCELKGKPFTLKEKRYAYARITTQVEQVNWKGEFVLIQAHCHDGNDPTFKGFISTLDGKTAVFKGGLRTDGSTSSPPKETIFSGIRLDSPFSAAVYLEQINSADQSMWAVRVTLQQGNRCEGMERTVDAKRGARPHVFHMGTYNQVNNDEHPAGAPLDPEKEGTRLTVTELLETFGHRARYEGRLDEAATTVDGSKRLRKLDQIAELIEKADLPSEDTDALNIRLQAIRAWGG